MDERVTELALAEDVFPEGTEHLRNNEKQINNKQTRNKMNWNLHITNQYLGQELSDDRLVVHGGFLKGRDAHAVLLDDVPANVGVGAA